MQISLSEQYISIHAPESNSPSEAVQKLYALYTKKLSEMKLSAESEIFIRFFCSDVTNQKECIEKEFKAHDSSLHIYIGQSPLDSCYFSLQAYHISTDSIKKSWLNENTLLLEHGDYQSIHQLALPHKKENAYMQSNDVIEQLLNALQSQELNIEEHCHRTWYYVRDIDNNYMDMIKSRTEYYEKENLTPQTHFIASTGIEASTSNPHALVFMQSWAIKNLQREQVQYLYALENLSPTALYGVNFERATKVTFGDREHCYISGTASIDKNGEIVHPNDVAMQCQRAIENIQALLDEANMDFSDFRSAIVYLRDHHEYCQIKEKIEQVFPKDCAINVVRGAVCRPGWLVELEGVAIKNKENKNHPCFS